MNSTKTLDSTSANGFRALTPFKLRRDFWLSAVI
jgi:hypothetical protein